MDDAKIAKRTEQIIKERGYEPELAKSIAKDEAITEEREKLLPRIGKQLKGAAESISSPFSNNRKTAWSQLTTEQFFSGYSEADAIYDNL